MTLLGTCRPILVRNYLVIFKLLIQLCMPTWDYIVLSSICMAAGWRRKKCNLYRITLRVDCACSFCF